jgi:senataxin
MTQLLVRSFLSAPVRILNAPLADFQFVLKSLIFLLRRLGSGFWDNEDIGFPQVIFDAVKDNPQYTLLLASSTAVTWHLDWFSDYLDTFWDLPAWGEVLAKTIYLLCGEAQHEGFKDVKPVVIVPAAQVR